MKNINPKKKRINRSIMDRGKSPSVDIEHNYLGNFFYYAPIIISTILLLYYVVIGDSASAMRYDKYELYMSPLRLLVITIYIPIIHYILKKTSDGAFGIIYPTNLFMALFVFMVLPGVLLTSDFSVAGNTGFYSYLVSFIFFTFGLISVRRNRTTRRVLNKQKRSGHSQPIRRKIYQVNSPVYVSMIGAYICGFFIVVVGLDHGNSSFNKIFDFFRSGIVDNSLAESVQTTSGGSFYIVISNYLLFLVMPITSVFVLTNGYLKNDRRQIFFGVFLCIVVFALTIFGGGRLKGLFFLLFLVVSYSMTKGVTFQKIVNALSVILWMLILQTIALGRISSAAFGESIVNTMVISFGRVVERILLTKGYVTQLVFQYIPDYTPYKYGATLWHSIVGSSSNDISFAREMFAFVYRGSLNGTAGPQAFGEAYANFGVIGMFVIAYILGIVVQYSTEFVKRNFVFDAFKLSFLAYFTVLMARLGYGDMLTFKSNGLHVLIFYYVFFTLFTKLLKR